MLRLVFDASWSWTRNKEMPDNMRQMPVLAFMVTSEGWIRLRNSLSRIQPSKPAAPMQNASSDRPIEYVRQRSGCLFFLGFPATQFEKLEKDNSMRITTKWRPPRARRATTRA